MERENTGSTLGRLTYTDLADTAAFWEEAGPDAWDVERPAFSRRIARMGAELSANSYSLHLAPWLEAGWTDCAFVLEDRIYPLGGEGDTRAAALEGVWKRRRARTLLQGGNVVTDMVRALRQIMVTDLGKAIVMTRREEGQVVVAISFIGTTEKYFDWFSNFKFQPQTGLHSGFCELARAFDTQAARVLLPQAGRALGEETFTLADAVLEAAKPSSRVRLWLSGHSQGGAIVQTYTQLLLARGVPAKHVHGYTYGAPSVAAVDGGYDPKAYPVYNIVNADDIVTRVGAQVRLGVDCIHRPTEAFRTRHYRVQEGAEEAVRRALYHVSQVRSTLDAICWGLAFFRGMQSLDSADLDSLMAALAPRLLLLRRANLGPLEIFAFFEGLLATQYGKLTGQDPDEARVAAYREALRLMLDAYGAKGTARALAKGIAAPHRLRPDKQDEAFEPPYIAIVRRHLDGCEQGVWLPEAPARCIGAGGAVLLPTRERHDMLAGMAARLPADGGAAVRPTETGGKMDEETTAGI